MALLPSADVPAHLPLPAFAGGAADRVLINRSAPTFAASPRQPREEASAAPFRFRPLAVTNTSADRILTPVTVLEPAWWSRLVATSPSVPRQCFC
jgi:hypothetical protein